MDLCIDLHLQKLIFQISQQKHSHQMRLFFLIVFQIYSILGSIYSDDSAPAFALYKFVQVIKFNHDFCENHGIMLLICYILGKIAAPLNWSQKSSILIVTSVLDELFVHFSR